MVFTRNGKELWAASGNSIAIIDVQNLQLIEQIRVSSLARQMITQLVSDGERVWTIDRKSSIVYQWDVKTRQKKFKFDCDVVGNAKGMILAQAVSDRLFDEISSSPPMSLKNRHQPVTIGEEKGKDEAPEKMADVPARLGNATVDLLKISPLLIKARKKLHMQPSILFSPKKRKLGRNTRKRQYEMDSLCQLRPRSRALNDTSIRLGQILLVGDSLWIGRDSGDILVMNVREPSSNSVSTSIRYNAKHRNGPLIFGEVMCHLEDEHGKELNYLKEIVQLRMCGKNRVVSAVRLESRQERGRDRALTGGTLQREPSQEKTTDNFKLLIFEAWQTSDFEDFSRNLHALHELEQ